jgi:hypothetical protein
MKPLLPIGDGWRMAGSGIGGLNGWRSIALISLLSRSASA